MCHQVYTKLKLHTANLAKVKNLNKTFLGMTVAHLGVAIFIAGITGSTLWKVEKIKTLIYKLQICKL